ncbi:MAG: bifunctional 2-C-methyl-D-erythritol 4-phosphate cytidylyltransferase/2-C-methyl-D-erythritol 2,4-cyclodiphosphate synthase [Aestuariivita sp.]|nr:bifunctional 2-C-methyl-D-erythritol 4-phosphate cytidylyltransferase/2-C-methyl-D-erythritol 2,4-cyclodiphosphate synthase [Aestuariivita sp.]
MDSTAAIILAAGRGTRAGKDKPKQWRNLAGKPVIKHSMDKFAQHPHISHLVLVVHPEDFASKPWPSDPSAEVVCGGETRCLSVFAGLQALEKRFECVLIHDSARPCVTDKIISNVCIALENYPAAAPGLTLVDALWRGKDGMVLGHQNRANLFRAQTPQGFHLAPILTAYQNYHQDAADDVEIARASGLEVAIVSGDDLNLKITTEEDFFHAERNLQGNMDIRLGNGFDVHKFCVDRKLILCGVLIPFELGLDGHSDADVSMHAITDAIYGALSLGDIGTHFPPSDAKWKNVASEVFLKHSIQLAAKQGYRVGNVDCTLICQVPKISPYVAEMRVSLSQIMDIDVEQISVKATTTEQLGFTGRKEGIASLATVTMVPS